MAGPQVPSTACTNLEPLSIGCVVSKLTGFVIFFSGLMQSPETGFLRSRSCVVKTSFESSHSIHWAKQKRRFCNSNGINCILLSIVNFNTFALLNGNWARTGSFTQSLSAADLGYGLRGDTLHAVFAHHVAMWTTAHLLCFTPIYSERGGGRWTRVITGSWKSGTVFSEIRTTVKRQEITCAK